MIFLPLGAADSPAQVSSPWGCGCEGLSEDKATLGDGKGPPARVWMRSSPNTARAVQGERVGDALPSLSEGKNIPKLRSTGPTWAKRSPPGFLITGRACHRLTTLIYAWLKMKSIYGKLEVSSASFCMGTKYTSQKLL